MIISYDSQTDVLYLRFEEVDEICDYIEPTPGAILRVGTRTGRIAGCTLLDFHERLKKHGSISIPEISAVLLPEHLRALIGA
ncbi:MAG: DUF2283 domain-containing protein [Bryobacteraceae bacterium]